MNHLNYQFKKLNLASSVSEINEPLRRKTVPIIRTRKHSELERCWELDVDREDFLIATSDVRSNKS